MDIIAGKFFVCGLTDDNFGSLPEKLQDKFKGIFKRPRPFSRWDKRFSQSPPTR
jgi:hypothetical protein